MALFQDLVCCIAAYHLGSITEMQPFKWLNLNNPGKIIQYSGYVLHVLQHFHSELSSELC